MISVLIPAYNESERIGATLRGLQEALVAHEVELIVIDDGSSDGTSEVARQSGARVVVMEVNSGKGAAMNRGIQEAQGEVMLLVDADLGESAGLVHGLLSPVLRREADLTIARFPQARVKGGFGLLKGLAHHGLYICTGNRYYSPISGQRAMRREVLDAIGGFKPGWGMEVAMTIDAHHHGFSIIEVPLEMTHRETQRNLAGFRHRGKQFRDIFITLCRSYWEYRVRREKRIPLQ